MDLDLRRRIGRQDDIVATWQLVRAGWSEKAVRHWTAKEGWRLIHDGVWAVAQAPLTQRQRWIAAVLTAPGTFLAGPSACCCYGFYDWRDDHETVVRRGSGGPRRYPGLLVARSATLAGHTTRRHRIPIVTAPRALIDLSLSLGASRRGRAFREACRLRCLTANELAQALFEHRGRRGTAGLAALCDRYATIPYHRCRSDPECLALEILHDAGIEPPRVNVRINNEEADLSWRRHRLVVEIDGPDFHRFADEDARKQAVWEDAGYTVHRISSPDVYVRPGLLLAVVNGHLPPR